MTGRLGAVLGVLALSGCQLVFGLDPSSQPTDGGTDAPPSSACGPYRPATELMLSGEPERDGPAIFTDRTELWLSVTPPGVPDRLVFARNTSGTFSTPVVPSFHLDGTLSSDPTLTADGLRLLFLSDRAGGVPRVFEAKRETPAGDFDTPSLVTSLGTTVSSLDVTADGRAVYFSGSDDQLFVARRTTLDDSFGPSEALGIVGEGPAISADELELYYVEDLGSDLAVRVRRRDSTGAAFADVVPVLPHPDVMSADDPDLSPDGRRLVVDSGDRILELVRDCM